MATPLRSVRTRHPRLDRHGNGFTLIEVIVAIAIIAVLAAFIAPRFGSVRRGEGVLAGDRIQDLMRMWAFRSSIGSQQVGISRNPESKFLTLWVRDTDPNDPEQGPLWREDRLSMPARLPDSVEIIEVAIDGERQDVNNWFVQTNPDRSRPRFSITLRDSGQRLTTVSVEPYSIATIRVDDEHPIAVRQPIDLDAEGQERVAW